MTDETLREEIDIQLELMEATVCEVVALCRDVAGADPTVREKTAAAAFAAQFYGGIENILKRIHCYHAIALPTGDAWHIELFQRFCPSGYGALPVLFDQELMTILAPYRKFRHVVYHGYGVQLDWARMAEGLYQMETAFSAFKLTVGKYLEELG